MKSCVARSLYNFKYWENSTIILFPPSSLLDENTKSFLVASRPRFSDSNEELDHVRHIDTPFDCLDDKYACVSSRMTWAFVPPYPKLLTDTRRGRSFGQGSSFKGTYNGSGEL